MAVNLPGLTMPLILFKINLSALIVEVESLGLNLAITLKLSQNSSIG